MFTVTDSALKQLSSALGGMETKNENACFRIVPDPSGKLALIVGEPTPEDAEYEHDGTTVLTLSKDIQERCDGKTLKADKSGSLVLA